MIESSHEFQFHIESAVFVRGITKLARHSIANHVEGGYIWRENKKPVVDLPTVEANKSSTAFELADVVSAIDYAHKSYGGGRHLAGGEGSYRTDINLFVHSHPGDFTSTNKYHKPHSVDRFLAPSIPDLENWEELSRLNPGMVTGVLATTVEQAKLLLWCNDGEKPIVARYQQFLYNPQSGKLREAMIDSGLRLATIDILPKPIDYTDQVLSATAQLFPTVTVPAPVQA